jgi:hypothetical protein
VQTLTVDAYKRIQMPDAKPGEVFTYERAGEVVKLTPVKPVEIETVDKLPDNMGEVSSQSIREAIHAGRR